MGRARSFRPRIDAKNAMQRRSSIRQRSSRFVRCKCGWLQLQVHIDPGAKDGLEIKFIGEGNQEPGITAGNIVIILDEQEHPVRQFEFWAVI